MGIKQVIVIRKDLKCRRGKEISQGAHASMAFLVKRVIHSGQKIVAGYDTYFQTGKFSRPEVEWLTSNHRKVTLQTETPEEFYDIYKKAKEAGLEVHIITDAGLTEFNGKPTDTCLAIGPDYDEKIDPITGNLKLY